MCTPAAASTIPLLGHDFSCSPGYACSYQGREVEKQHSNAASRHPCYVVRPVVVPLAHCIVRQFHLKKESEELQWLITP